MIIIIIVILLLLPLSCESFLKVSCVQVFYYHAEYLGGEVKLQQEELVDHLWVTRDELQEYLEPELYKFARLVLPH